MVEHAMDDGRMIDEAELWQQVQAHMPLIERLVGTAVARGYIPTDQRDDAVTDCTILTYTLVQRHDPNQGKLEHYLRAYLSRELRNRHTTDALDRATEDETAATNVRADRTWTVLPSGHGGRRIGAGGPKGKRHPNGPQAGKPRCSCGKHTLRTAIARRLKCRIVGPSAPPVTSL